MLEALTADTLLYKFKAIGSEDEWLHLRQLVVEHKAYLASPKQLNDVYECKPLLRFEGSQQEKLRYVVGLFEKFRPGLSEEELVAEVARASTRAGGFNQEWADHVGELSHKALQEDLGVFCLSAAPDHPLMWAHYGQGHTGICLEFMCTVDDAFWGRTMKVAYQQPYPIVNVVRQSHQEIALNTVMIKGKDWEYEKEWRIVDFERGAGLQEYPQGSLRSIILGSRVPEANISRVKELIRHAPVPVLLKRAFPRQGAYGVDFRLVADEDVR